MDQYYQGKVAVVTGAAGIICSEVSRDLAALGCTVALVDLSLENAEKVAASIRENGGIARRMPATSWTRTRLTPLRMR